MKFSELTKEQQSFLIGSLDNEIERKAEDEGISTYSDPSDNEYADFFDNFDENYEIIDDYPQSTVQDEFHAKYSIEFHNGKVILNTFENEDNL